jgi:hypothetical protein
VKKAIANVTFYRETVADGVIIKTDGFDGDYRAYYQNICERLKSEINEKVETFV